jgi:hypothetical protein
MRLEHPLGATLVLTLLPIILLFIACTTSAAQVPGGSLEPTTIPKYVTPLAISAVMPKTGTVGGNKIDYYEIAARQFQQQILPAPMPTTMIWGYGQGDRILIPCNDVDRRLESDLITGS